VKSVSENEKIPLWARDRPEKPESSERVAQVKYGALGQLFFFAAFFAFILRFLIGISGLLPMRPELLNTILVVVGISCAIAKIALQRYSLRRLLFTVAICGIIGYSAIISVNFLFLQSFLLIIAMQDMKFENVVRFGFYCKLIAIIIHVIAYIFVFNINPDVITFVYRAGIGDPRHYFFMGHANTFMSILLWTCLEFIYLNYKKVNLLHFATIWAIYLIFFYFTRTLTGIFLLVAVTLLVAFDKLGKDFYGKLLTFLTKYLYVFFAIAISFLVVVYTRLSGMLLLWWHALDNFFTGRLWFGAFAYYDLGPTLFGRPDRSPQRVFWAGRYFRTMTVFDNYYLGNFLSYGLVNTIATIIALIVLAGRMENKEKIILILFALYGLMSSEVSNITICFALLIFGKYVYMDKKENDSSTLSQNAPKTVQ